MKIAVLSSHTPSLFWFRMDMMQSFIANGYEVIAIGDEAEEKWQDAFNEKNIKYIKADISRNGTNPLNDLKTLRSLKKILKSERPDKIFAYQAKTVVYGGIAARLLGIKDVYSLIAGVGSVFLSTGLKAKIVRFILTTEYKIALKGSKRVFFQNGDDVDLFVANKIIKPEKVAMMNGSGVNLEKFTPFDLPSECAFLSISRLIKDKGVTEYLNAARIVKQQYKNVRFMLVGPFDSNPSALKPEELQPYIDDGTVEYFGEQSDVKPYIDLCSVYVLPSYREGTPKTVLEAMAVGRAIITTDAPGCRETVTDGVNGFLVPVKDVEALAEKMIEMINSPDRVRQMAAEGRKMVEQKYDVKIVNKNICETMKVI
ncbi:MAG: glycosyltransferase family 4 protein [Clostridia bacterium]|nr:glycosyltransferase family 4 protein [Clostridia bacterium]